MMMMYGGQMPPNGGVYTDGMRMQPVMFGIPIQMDNTNNPTPVPSPMNPYAQSSNREPVIAECPNAQTDASPQHPQMGVTPPQQS
jgi:hypothetical protein